MTTRPQRSHEQVLGDGVTWLARWTLRWLLVGVGLVALGWLVGQLWSIVLPVVLALVLTTVLVTPARLAERRLGVPPVVAALLTVVVALAVVIVAILLAAPVAADQAAELGNSAADGLARVRDWLADSGLLSQAQVDDFVASAQDRLRSSGSDIASGVLVGASAVGSALVTAVLTLVLTFFFIKDGRRFLPWLRRVTGPDVGWHLTEVATRAWFTLGGFIRTQALVGLIDAVLIGIGLLLVGVPLVLPLALLTFVAAFVPVVGAVVIGVLAVLVALVAQGGVAALAVLGIVLLVQQVEGNVLLPWLQGRSLRLHAGVVLLAVVLGSSLFGVAGAFLGVPFVAIAAVVARYLLECAAERAEQPSTEPPTGVEAGEGADPGDTEPDATGADATGPDRP